MSISQKHLTYLNEMGIMLWQRKALNKTDIQSQETTRDLIEISDAERNKSRLLADVYRLFDLTMPHSQTSSTETLNSLTWYFHSKQQIELIDNTLYSPTPAQIAQSTELKKQLWQNLIHYLDN